MCDVTPDFYKIYFLQLSTVSLQYFVSNLTCCLLNARLEWNLKEFPNAFVMRQKWIIFHSWKESPYNLLTHEHWALILRFGIVLISGWKTILTTLPSSVKFLIFHSSSTLWILQIVRRRFACSFIFWLQKQANNFYEMSC